MAVARLDQAKSQRLQVDLTSPQVAALQKLMTVCGIETRKDLVNNALTLLEWAVEEVQKGNEVASLDKDRKRYDVLRMPALMHAVNFAKEHKRSSLEDQRKPQLDLIAR